MAGRRSTSTISRASSHDTTGSSRPERTASTTAPGTLSGRMNPETQTLASMTTRSPVPPHLGDGSLDVMLDLLDRPSRVGGQPTPPAHELPEARRPVVFADSSDALPLKPGVDRLANELRHRPALAPADQLQRRQVVIVEVDVCPL